MMEKQHKRLKSITGLIALVCGSVTLLFIVLSMGILWGELEEYGDFLGRDALEIAVSQHPAEFGSDSFVIGNTRFTVKRPTGFVLLEDHAVKAAVVHPPGNELHLVFVSELDAARIMNGDTPNLDRYVAIQSNRKLDSQVITPTMFGEVKSKIRSQGFAEAIPTNLQKVNEFLSGKGQSIEEAMVIQFTEMPDSYTVTSLVKHGGQKVRVNTLTMRNLRDCCIMVASTALCRNQDDIDWSKSVATECAQSLNWTEKGT